MAAALVHVLGTRDIKYDTRSFGGEFFENLPRRVGCSPLLDATISAAVSSYHAVVSRAATPSASQNQQQKAFMHYGTALQALRSAMEKFDDRAPLAITHRMYAIILLSYCQEWIDPVNKDTAPHREMLVHLLQRALRVGKVSELEKEYVYPFCQMLSWEAWVNPRLNVEEWLWALIDVALAGPRPHKYCNQHQHLPFTTLDVGVQARTALLLRDPARNMVELRRINDVSCAERAQMRVFVAQMIAAEMGLEGMTTSEEELRKARTRRVSFQVGMGLMIFFGSGVNRALQRFSHSDPDLDLAVDMHIMVDDAIEMAGLCTDLRPFGSMFVPKVLKVVWAGLPDDDGYRRVELETWLRFFECDFEGADYVDAARGVRERLDVVSGAKSIEQGGFTHGIYARAMEIRAGSW